jgi:hypothetical protein
MNRKRMMTVAATVLGLISVAAALSILDFNGLPFTGAPLPIPSGYAGMNWTGLDYVTTKFANGPRQNIAVPAAGTSAQVMTTAVPGESFRLFGLSATGYYSTTLTVYAYNSGKFVGSRTFNLAPVHTPMQFPEDWGNVTQVTFVSRDAEQRPAPFNLYSLTFD